MSILHEEWRDIPGCPGYQASSLGRIRSLDRQVAMISKYGKPFLCNRAGRILVQGTNPHGYRFLFVGSPVRSTTVHRLIALAFLGHKPDGLQINHKDGDKLNNRPENIEYVTSAKNNHHAISTGLRKMKLSDAEIETVKSMAVALSFREIGRRFGVSYKTVSKVVNDRRTRRADAGAD
jgi:DNA-binding CsgD family transcriptional regulator